jgi:small subunit ribosomal protein S20
MPIIKSAKKRVRVAYKAGIANSKTKRTMRATSKDFYAALDAKKDTTEVQNKAFSAIDTAYKKGIISKNKAARKKAQINAASKAAGTTKVGTKTAKKPADTAKKPVAKKAPVKKSPVKKSATKKTTK